MSTTPTKLLTTKKANFISQIFFFTLLPIIGILFLDWDWRQIIVLYYLEIISLAIATVIRIGFIPFRHMRITPGPTTKFSSDAPRHADPTMALVKKVAAILGFIYFSGTILVIYGQSLLAFFLTGLFGGTPMVMDGLTIIDAISMTPFVITPILLFMWLSSLGWKIATTIIAAKQSKVENDTTATTDSTKDSTSARVIKEFISFFARVLPLHIALVFGLGLMIFNMNLGLHAEVAIMLIVVRAFVNFIDYLLTNFVDHVSKPKSSKTNHTKHP